MNIQKRNLVFYAPNTLGGVRTYLINISVHLKDLNIEHKVVFYGEPVKYCIEENLNIDYVFFDNFDSYKSQLYKLKTFINEHSVIISNDRAEIDMCKYFGLKNLLVYIMHGDLIHYRNILKEQIIDLRLFVSEHLSKKYAFPFKKNNVIFPIVDISREKDFGRLESKKSNIKIAFVGRLEKEKGADEIIRLNELLDISWGFFIPKLNSDLNFIEGIKLKKIEFDLPNSELLIKLSDYDYLFFPSRSEGFGIAVLEAIKLGVIPIVRDIEMGIMQLLSDNINTLKFTDVNSLKNVLENLQLNKEQYNSIVIAGLELSKEKFDSQTTCEKFINEINKLELNQNKQFGHFDKHFSFFIPTVLYRILKKIIFKYAKS